MVEMRSGSPLVETLALFVIVYALQLVAALFSLALLAGLFVLQPPLESNSWTIVTSVYAHNGLGHLFSNAIALVIVGWPIARATTRVRFHVFFVTTGALAGISQIVLTDAAASVPAIGVTATSGVLGASGAVFALMGYLLAANRLSEGLAGLIDVSRWLTLLVFLVIAAAVTWATGAPGVALVAHFTGFLLGLVAGRMRLLRPT